MDFLKDGLAPFVQREFKNKYRDLAESELASLVADDRINAARPVTDWDVAPLLKVMWESWNEVFRYALGQSERSLVSELRDHRRKWAHQQTFTGPDTYRVIDSATRLLTAISAPQVGELEKMRSDLQRFLVDEQNRSERRRSATLIESTVTGVLKPWREVVTPHRDVASGRYQQAEFAADLWQVHIGEASSEYMDPAEFFRRTYLTQSLKGMLVNAVRRLSGGGGDPVVQLQTNFGGGKTHSMLALYHMVSGVAAVELDGMDQVLADAGTQTVPKARRVVLVGNKISPSTPDVKADGTVVRTLWGELAWQLGGAAAYERIKADDENATSPGDALRILFNDFGPSLILVDEWVAYARQLHHEKDLAAGDFETQFSFAQALTESAKAAKNCLLVISLPASDTSGVSSSVEDVEVGGQRGREALERLRNVVGRVEASWRPASAEEGFEIVRRRLFEPLVTDEQFRDRDRIARAFADLYRAQKAEFPPECSEADYEKRLKAAYPIHPEIFDRLYNDWSGLVKFQRTRGVLRLMSAVIHSLWESSDRNPLILPAYISIDDQRVQFELTRYLSDGWVPVIEKDVDGRNSLPSRIDGEQPNLGKLSACRRVARTIYLGSAPLASAAHRGMEDRRIKLGCVMPGEAPAVFGDALRRLAGAATYLYQDGARYWYSTQPTVTKLAEDRAEQMRREPDKIAQEVFKRLQKDVAKRGEFKRVHVMPRSGQEVQDEPDVGLVILGMDSPYMKDNPGSAEAAAMAILESRGNSPRMYRNSLVFLAADKGALQDLDEAVRRYLAWQSIEQDTVPLNLDQLQQGQAKSRLASADSTVMTRIPETFLWLLVPGQGSAQDPGSFKLEIVKLGGSGPLAENATKKLQAQEKLLTRLAGSSLKMELDRIPLWRGNHVPVKQLAEDFSRYTYLPRLRDQEVLAGAVRDGVALLTFAQDGFAYADSWDEGAGRYRGLRGGEGIPVSAGNLAGLLVKGDVAAAQMDAEAAAGRARTGMFNANELTATAGGVVGGVRGAGPATPKPQPKRFHGTVQLDPQRVSRDINTIAEELISHLVGHSGAKVTITLEIEATFPDGAPDPLVRTVTENASALKFQSHEFEVE